MVNNCRVTDNEKLIKEARRAKGAVCLATDASVADDLSRIIGSLADALEAVEKAHTPTGEGHESGKLRALGGGESEALCPDCRGELTSWFCDRCSNTGVIKREPQGEPSGAVTLRTIAQAVAIVQPVTFAEEVEDLITAVTENISETGAVVYLNEDELYMGDGSYPKITAYVPLADVEKLMRDALTSAAKGGDGR